MRTSTFYSTCLAATLLTWGCGQSGERTATPKSTSSNTFRSTNPNSNTNTTVGKIGQRHPTPETNVKPNSTPHTNRLAKEKSPYLLQHAHNPVDWFPWGEEAFAKAKKEDKPIFLSIGYSTCHWCHVMERESFEDEEVGALLNKHFICIKLDREERPDVDKIYMSFVQATTGGGGWPMSVFLTPEKNPFFGGTYFPKRDFMSLCSRVNELWNDAEKRPLIEKDALNMARGLAEASARKPDPNAKLNFGLLTNGLAQIKATYDPRFGGFGDKPKFPRPSEPAFVLWQAARAKDADGIRMVTHTCERMAAGGMYDQLGGGFSRYSVDEKWLVPHFEKMLYDNAQLIHLYLDAYLVSGDEQHAAVVRDILRYLARDMTHEDGGWYSAEDADSEGQEGKFYCWTKTELEKILNAEEAALITRHYGITEHGNFEDHSHPNPLKNLNVLSIVDPKLTDADKALLSSARKKMDAVRDKRIRPHLDDKILSSWNGLMLGAMARAYAVLGDAAYLKMAEANNAFILKTFWDAKTKTMYHRWRDGERDSVQLLDAYAFQLDGTLHLYEATLKPEHLTQAIALADRMIELFFDKENGGFFQNAGSPDLIVRAKEDYDGALPSSNSVAALAFLKLHKMTENKVYRDKAEATLKLFAANLERGARGVPYLMMALDFYLHEPYRVVVAGAPGDAATQKILRAVHGQYQPNRIVLGNTGPVEEFAKKLKPGKDGPEAFICSGRECKQPTHVLAEIQKYLQPAPPTSIDLLQEQEKAPENPESD